MRRSLRLGPAALLAKRHIMSRAEAHAPMVAPSLVLRLDDLIRGDLQALRNSYFHLLLVFTGLVAVGVLLEEAESFPFISKATFDSVKGLLAPRHRVVLWLKRLSKLGWILVVAGVIGEGIFEGYVSEADGLLQDFNNVVLSEANVRAARANERAAYAEQEAAEDKLELARLKAPRILSSRQRLALIHSLGKITKFRIQVLSLIGNNEAAHYAMMLASALGEHGANWPVDTEMINRSTLENAGPGIIILYGKKDKSKAMALQRAFRVARIATKLILANKASGDITLFVSEK